mmetsp:Transcript_15559/g.48698  ORF Transcript_15559/g.48698 Transcript_15559/m.48698 type:complete len:228 (-) Transcript_15559:67-750(-)
MLGAFCLPCMAISLSNSSSSPFTVFSATFTPLTLCNPSNTAPNEPDPNFPKISISRERRSASGWYFSRYASNTDEGGPSSAITSGTAAGKAGIGGGVAPTGITAGRGGGTADEGGKGGGIAETGGSGGGTLAMPAPNGFACSGNSEKASGETIVAAPGVPGIGGRGGGTVVGLALAGGPPGGGGGWASPLPRPRPRPPRTPRPRIPRPRPRLRIAFSRPGGLKRGLR